MLTQSVFLVLRRIQAWRNPGGTLSEFSSNGKHLSNGKRNRDLESVQDSFTNSLKRMLIMLFKETARLRQDFLKRRRNWTQENG